MKAFPNGSKSESLSNIFNMEELEFAMQLLDDHHQNDKASNYISSLSPPRSIFCPNYENNDFDHDFKYPNSVSQKSTNYCENNSTMFFHDSTSMDVCLSNIDDFLMDETSIVENTMNNALVVPRILKRKEVGPHEIDDHKNDVKSAKKKLRIAKVAQSKTTPKKNSNVYNDQQNNNVSTDPQISYARKRREKVNARLKILQNLIPHGTKVDISTMLEEAVHYVKFLQLQIKVLSSEEMWMYAPLAYNGMDLSLQQNFNEFL